MDNSNKKTAILGIFAKQPIPGWCKTRLCPPLTHEEAAALYHCSLTETVQRLQRESRYDLAICYDGERSWFADSFPGIPLLPQWGGDLGTRMAVALNGFLKQGYRQAVLVGSDSPDLPLALVRQAFSALQQVEVVIAPATDGGYVLIGETKHHPELFDKITWSTGQVLRETLLRTRSHEIPVQVLEAWDDLDDLESLEKFLDRSPQAKTAVYLRKQLGRLFPSG